ncbi:MAG: HIT domain-containing protein [Alphaproteobacteria bacterium GM7ARS4]|nr:HIT domain-containing protein [Alphaproteobacteria bacterium GM7ARS4]
MPYDSSNIFAQIVRGTLPAKKVYEDDHVIAFHDIRPLADVHVLVIPKGAYDTMSDFAHNGTDTEITALVRAIGKVASLMSLEEHGYRVIINQGQHGGQEVAHVHAHIIGGNALGPMLSLA